METNATLIVGLGNPGKDYERTRHNAGFIAIDILAKKLGLSWKLDVGHRSVIAEGNIDGRKLILVKPTTYMNASGESVRLIFDMFHLKPANLIVIADDVALPLGTVRVRADGSAGGHNGMKSIIQHIGTQTFWRIRIGVNPPPPGETLEAYVLNRFRSTEQNAINLATAKAVELLLDLSTPLKDTTYSLMPKE